MPSFTVKSAISSITMRLLPNASYASVLQRTYGQQLYSTLTIPAAAYPGPDADVPVVGVANVLVVNAAMPDALAFDITRLLFEKQSDLIAIHPEAEKLSLKTATQGSPAPYHPGAIRYYKAQHAWAE